MNPPKTDARRHHDPQVRGFASDNYAGAHPEVLAALALANGGHQVAYGEDDYTENLQRIIRSHFGATAEAFPVFRRSPTGDTLLLYTDGLIEARDATGSFYPVLERAAAW
ncbi:SpoIIE family protein phosphatase, partial [Streptomyces olivaceoviridis]